MPQRVTIWRARLVACSMSLSAPVVGAVDDLLGRATAQPPTMRARR